ncbi:MAG: ABC transporter permease, partial [Nitrospira sp.]|nr:ABC transporter permease [Nitrospira sp.]
MFAFLKVFALILSAHITQRPLRTLLTVLGVALGVSASVAVRTANVDVLQSFEQAVMTVAGPTTLEVSGGELGLDERMITAIRNVPGVTSASPVILQTAVKHHGGSHQAMQVIGLDLLAEIDSRGFRFAQESAERRLETMLDPTTLFLGRKIAAEWNLSKGDTVELHVGPGVTTCRIEGILEDAQDRTSSWDRLAVMDIAAAQIMFGMVGRLDRIDLITEEGYAIETVAEAVRAVVPPDVVIERPASRTGQVEQMLRAFRLNVTVLSWVGLLVGMFLIYNTMAFAVAQRRREIGIYRAVGMTQSRVAGLFLTEAAVLGLAGGVVGSGAGFLLAQELVSLLSRTITDLYVPVGGGTGHLLESEWFLTLSSEGMLIGCVVSMLGAIGPSLDAGRTAPARALAPGDYEAGRRLQVGWLSLVGLVLLAATGLLSTVGPVGGVPVPGYAATLCLLAGLSCVAPMCITGWRRHGTDQPLKAGMQGVMRDIAIDHASRNPGRNGVTVSALMVGLAIMIGVLVMVRSFRHTVEVWVADTVIADVVVAPSLWLRGTEAGSVGKSLPGSWSAALSSIPG